MTNQNYANRNLQNYSFKGQDLIGADFTGSDLRGCNFTRANLSGANFEGVRMGQSHRQVNRLVAAAIIGPVVLVGVSIIIAQVPSGLFSDRSSKLLDFFRYVFPILAVVVVSLIRDSVAIHFPLVSTVLSNTAIATLFAVMVLLTVGLAIAGIFSFGDGAFGQGFFLLLLMVISAIITFRIFKWLIHFIKSSAGTSFRKANLTDANFSHAVVQNTDFSYAVLTGACILDWVITAHTQFSNVHCEYLYLEPTQHKRQPAVGNFQHGELEQLFTQFMQLGGHK